MVLFDIWGLYLVVHIERSCTNSSFTINIGMGVSTDMSLSQYWVYLLHLLLIVILASCTRALRYRENKAIQKTTSEFVGRKKRSSLIELFRVTIQYYGS